MQKATAPKRQRRTLVFLSAVLFAGNAGCWSHSLPPATRTLANYANNTIPAWESPLHKPILPVVLGNSVSTGTTNNVISYWDSPLQESVPEASPSALQHFREIDALSRFRLVSKQPFHEVDIPLWFNQGIPFLRASWSGRQIVCAVDTGTSTIWWPQWLHLNTQQLHISQIHQWTTGVRTRSEWVLTTRIATSGLVLVNVPTEAIGFARPRSSDPSPLTITFPLLGLEAFNAFVFTLDYSRKKLILRDTNYDVTHRPHSAHSMLLPYNGDADERVVISGKLAGHKAVYLLDTGTVDTYVTPTFAQKYLSFVPNQAPVDTGRPPVLHHVPGTLNDWSFHIRNLYVMKRPGNLDIYAGWAIFSRYRVTVDPFRHMVLLEKN